MKILKIEVNGLPNFENKLEICFMAQQRVSADDKEKLVNVFSNIYVNKVVSFVGINASGKTTILKTISFVMKMLNNQSINNIQSRVILNDMGEDDQVVITTFFYDGSNVNKLETYIGKEISDMDGSERFVIRDEILWSKGTSKVEAKKNIFQFSDGDLKKKRDKEEQYLMDDISIIVAENKKRNSSIFIRDMLEWTDHNIINVLGRFPRELLTFLDPSIEYLECTFKEKKVDIRLKFYGKDEVVINSTKILENYLSSGTIKGLGVFMSAIFAFSEGGYLIIDEIENHFNREIVATLIRFFMDAKVNKNDATLIFSTHYSELLDEFDRNDGIYVVRNKAGISAENMSEILKRNDIKKSEIYDSDYLGGTVPAYEAYMALKKVLLAVK
ncbi:AAA family ATPase [Lachnospiraceae bacterium HCP1S3_C3]